MEQEYVKEIIVADNGSTDQSLTIVNDWTEKYPGIIRVIEAHRLSNANYARNAGLNYASGDFVQWLDADDQLLPGKLALQVKQFQSHPEIDIVYSDWQLDTYTISGEMERQEFKIAGERNDFLESLLTDNWLPPHTYLLRKSMADKLAALGLWNESTEVLQDREYFTLAALIGARFSYCPSNLVIYNRWNKNSISQGAGARKRALSLLAQLQEFEKIIDQNNMITPERRSRYKRIINAQLVEAAMQVNATDVILPSLREVDWLLIKGIKTRLKCIAYLTKCKFKKPYSFT